MLGLKTLHGVSQKKHTIIYWPYDKTLLIVSWGARMMSMLKDTKLLVKCWGGQKNLSRSLTKSDL